MSRVVRKKKNMQKNRLKTVLIVLAIAVCLFVIYKFNFTTRSEVEITTPVKFKEFESEYEISSNIQVLEDDKGKYIILPEKVNGIFTSAYYLSEKDNKPEEKPDNTVSENTTVDNTISNTATENTTVENIVSNTVVENTVSNSVTNNIVSNTVENAVKNETQNTVSNTPADKNNTVANETTDNKTQNEVESGDTSSKEEIPEANIEEQIAAISEPESLFDKATQDPEDYADKLEEIAGSNNPENEENKLPEDTKEDTKEPLPEDKIENVPEQPAKEETPAVEQPAEEVKTEEKEVPETGKEIITEKPETLPGEKYYISEEDFKNGNVELTVKFQKIEINGEELYNQELTADMINALVKLTCYTPLGYYLDVKEEDVNNIQELKADVEKLANSETILAYDIKITNGEKEYQPEEYYQVAKVSITKPETLDFKSKSHSLQLLHIKEDEETVDFQRVKMSNIENDSIEFLTDEFSVYAIILFNAITDEQITIDDYMSDYNYLMGKNYTDNNGEYTPTYTDANLARVIVNYHGNSTEEKVYAEGQKDILVNRIIDTSSTENFSSALGYQSFNVIDNSGDTRNVSLTFSLGDITPDMIPANSTFTLTNLNLTFDNDYSLENSNNTTNSYTRNGNNITRLTVNAGNYDRNNNTITVTIRVTFNGWWTWNFEPNVGVTQCTLNGTRYKIIEEYETYNYRTALTTNDSGYISDTERQNIVSYVKCMPVVNGNVSFELIDNPFMDRVTAKTEYYELDDTGFNNPLDNLDFEKEELLHGFNGWKNAAGQNHSITFDNRNKVQTITAACSPGGTITIDLYANWEKANTVYISSSGSGTGSAINDVLGCGNIGNAVSKLVNNGIKTATNASNRELNIIVHTAGTIDASQFRTQNGCAYTITSLYAGHDYRQDGASVRSDGNVTLSTDLQMDFLNITNGGNYQTTGDGTYYINGNGYNLRIGRGMKPLGNTATFGLAEGGWRNTKTRCVIESGNYAQMYTVNGNMSINGAGFLEIIVGSDYDRVKGDHTTLNVYDRFSGRSQNGVASLYENNTDVYRAYVKSGSIGIGCFENEGSGSANYAGIYVGGHGVSTTTSTKDSGNRTLIVEGGNIANIIGGLFIHNNDMHETYTYVKGGNVINIVGGAGYTHTYGDRIIQVTDGFVKYSISGGSNGVGASSNTNNGQLTGKSLVYVGGTSRIGASSVRNPDGTETINITDQNTSLYDVKPGCVCGGANGNNNYAGQTDGSHIIVDGQAIVYGNVYGGGNYGFIQNGAGGFTLENGKIYNITSGSNAMYRIAGNNNVIGFNSLGADASYQWTVELTGGNTFYLKHGTDFVVAPAADNSNNFTYSANRNNATEFTYNNRLISYRARIGNRNRTVFLTQNNNNNISSTITQNNALEFDFNEINKKAETVVSIDIYGGTIVNSIFGGSNRNKIGGNVGINIYGGKVEQTVYGGSNESGNIEGDVNIYVEGGMVGKIASQDSIFGGGFGTATNINRNVNITIKDTTNNINILGNVYGGSSLGNIIGTTNIKVEDHYSDKYSISMAGNIFGGGKGIIGGVSPRSTGNVTINVDGGKYNNLNIYGGYNDNGTIPNSNIAVNIGENFETTVNDVYGGGNNAHIVENTKSVIVKMFKNAIVNNAYNGGNNAGINGTITREIYAIGANVNNLFGGSNNSGDLTITNVYVSDGAKVKNVFGGGNEARITDYTNVDIINSEVLDSVYGGGNDAPVNRYTDVDIQNSKVGTVYGGGNAGTVDEVAPPNGNSTNINIVAGSNIGTVYGGGCSASIKANSAVYIEDSTVKNVYGGGEGENATVEANTSVVLQGTNNKAIITENVYGGGDLGKVNGNAVVTINNSDIAGSVFGGGNNADIQNNASVTCEKATAGNIYGGGMNGAINGSTAVTIHTESTINNNVFGGGSKGEVVGNTVVNLNNSKVMNNLFGGGEAAEVNGTTVSLTNNSEVNNVYGGGDNGVTITNTSVALRNVKVIQSAFGAGNGTPAIVKGKSYIYADGTTTVGKSLFAGGNNSSTGTTETNPNQDLANKPIEKATAVADIAGATIGENVYGGANTSVIYGDVVVNIGNEAIKNYYTSINSFVPNYTSGKIEIGGTIYGGGEQMDPNKEYNYDTVSVEGYIKINIDGTGYDTADNSMDIKGSIFGSGHASRAGLPTSYIGDAGDSEDQTAGYVTINGDLNVKNYGSIKAPKSMVSIQRCKNVILDHSSLWISGATDSTNTHSSTYFSFNHIDALKVKNNTTLYLRATSNLLKSYYSLVDVNGKEEKATVEIVNEITGEDGKTYDAVGNYIYGLTGDIKYVLKSGQIFTADKDGNAIELVTDVKNSKTKSVTKNVDNRIYMYSGLNLNISADENLGDDTWGPVEGMTFFGIFNTSNTELDKNEDVDISQTTDTNDDFATIHTGIYDVDYQVSDTTPVKWEDRNYNRCYVEGKHVKSPQEQDIQKDGFYTNYEKFGIPYGDEEEVEEGNYASHNPTSYTDYILPTPEETDYYIWYAGPDQDFYYYDLALIASKLSTYGTIEKTLQGLSVANATFKITGVDSSLINGATLYEKSKIPNINTTGNPNTEFALAMKTGGSGWSMNGETDFITSPAVDFSGTTVYKTENSDTTPSLGFYLYHSNNISEELELGYFTINMILYYWKTPTQQAKARVTIDVAIATKVYEDLGYDASITPGREYELFPRTTTNITTKSSFSAYFQLHEKDFSNNKDLKAFFSHKEYADKDDKEGVDVVDTELIDQFIKTNYRLIKTDYVFPEDTTITMLDNSTGTPTYYYYTVTAQDNANKKKAFKLSEFRKMGSMSETVDPNTAEYYLDSNRSEYITTVNEDGKDVTYQSENFIFIVDFESAKFKNIDSLYEIVKNQAFHLVLTSDVKNKEGEALEISVLEEYKERNSISFGIYNTESTIKINATMSPNKIYVGDSTQIDIETDYITDNKDSSNVTTVYDTRYFDSKLGVKITIFDEAGDVVHGANLLGAYFKITEADGNTASYYPRTDGTTRIKIADKVSNSKATISFETAKSTLPTGTYKFLIESFGSADGVYFGVKSSDSTELTLSIVNDEFGLESEVPSNYVIVDKETGYTLEDTTGYTVQKEYEILDEDGNVIGKTTEELNEGKNDFEYSVRYSSGYENPYISISMYRRNYDSVYDRTYSLVDLKDYINIDLPPVPDNIKEQFAITDIDDAGVETKQYVGYEAYGIDFINKAVEDAIAASPDPSIRPIIKLTTKCSLKENLVSGTYKLVFTLYDKSEVEKLVEITNPDGTITAELKKVIEYQRIGETYSYVIIK